MKSLLLALILATNSSAYNTHRQLHLQVPTLVISCEQWADLVGAVEELGPPRFLNYFKARTRFLTRERRHYYQAFANDAIAWWVEGDFQGREDAWYKAMVECGATKSS